MGKKPIYIKAEKVAKNSILSCCRKNKWIIGDLLGEGGFGLIYLTKQDTDKKFDKVLKIEPSSNGPLFTEINFYKRVCSESEIQNWCKIKKLSHLAIPLYLSNGSYKSNDIENRFLIMERYGDDLHKTLMKQCLSDSTIFQIIINLIDALEYIHSHDYTHSDIKALNVMLDFNTGKKIYLMDFGMVSKYAESGKHKPEKIDKKNQHNGTLDFCPRDSHVGRVSSRRSDIESLLYNMLFWITWDNTKSVNKDVGCGKLPWLSEVILFNKSGSKVLLTTVACIKETYMMNADSFIERLQLTNSCYAKELKSLIQYVNSIQYTECPNYDELRQQMVRLICISKSKKFSQETNIDKYRDIDWSSDKTPRKRKSYEINNNCPHDLLEEDTASSKKSKKTPTGNNRVKMTPKRLKTTPDASTSKASKEPILSTRSKAVKEPITSKSRKRNSLEAMNGEIDESESMLKVTRRKRAQVNYKEADSLENFEDINSKNSAEKTETKIQSNSDDINKRNKENYPNTSRNQNTTVTNYSFNSEEDLFDEVLPYIGSYKSDEELDKLSNKPKKTVKYNKTKKEKKTEKEVSSQKIPNSAELSNHLKIPGLINKAVKEIKSNVSDDTTNKHKPEPSTAPSSSISSSSSVVRKIPGLKTIDKLKEINRRVPGASDIARCKNNNTATAGLSSKVKLKKQESKDDFDL